MTAKPVPFRQADISRALKGARAAGFDVGRIEIATDGRIIITPRVSLEKSSEDPLAAWEKEYDARKA